MSSEPTDEEILYFVRLAIASAREIGTFSPEVGAYGKASDGKILVWTGRKWFDLCLNLPSPSK